MARRLVRMVLLAGLVATVAACSPGPVGIGALPVSGESWSQAQVYTCLDSPGRLHISVDSTAVFDPDVVKVEISNEATGGEDLFLVAASGNPAHFEGTSTKVHPAGSCPYLRIMLLCVAYASNCAREWSQNSSQSFNYTVSLVP